MTKNRKNLRILVIDDEPYAITLVSDMLQDNYAVSVAKSAAQGLEQISNDEPFIILTDIKMPEMDGITFLKKVKETNGNLIPVILMTGHGSKTLAIEAVKEGAFDFLEKPFEGEELLFAIKRAVTFRTLIEEKKIFEEKQQEFVKQLQSKNYALNEIIENIENKKKENYKHVQTNYEILINPFLDQFALKCTPEQQFFIKLFKTNLKTIFEPLIANHIDSKFKFTPKELQISNLIKNGMGTKEISSFLCLSEKTISKHRENIREKLHIKKTDVNLQTLLISQ